MLTSSFHQCFPLLGQGQAHLGAGSRALVCPSLPGWVCSVGTFPACLPPHPLPSPELLEGRERPLFVLAQLFLNCFASFLLFSFVVFLFVCVAVGPRAPGRMNF